ncbi:hypothetical protein B0J11DRAFT_72571 [Dendryphion nanum]|uniref:Uncharacterized protein n=1 Tax=Dendryphion nanum TaxID=256645 RepID=A0A9P9DIN7_9PLEO|nr:hypothetical protein B0J11DRAFT_72571 [Dendryphion nanum]
MGWIWGDNESSVNHSKLDPSLQDFLDKEAPSGQKPFLPSKPTQKTTEPEKSPTTVITEASSKPTVPPQSQFQDGRYADIWKGYEPQHVVEDRGKSEQDKLRDIVDAYNDRKGEIGRVAMENCAFEYMAQYDCWKSPTLKQMATVCYTESRKFNRCYDIQTKFLKALGYMTMERRTKEQDEALQMHADKLYQRLLEQEALIAKAKEEGRPLPKFESVLSKQNVSRAALGPSLSPQNAGKTEQDEESDVWSHIKTSSRTEYEKKLAELPPEEQDLERKALLGELKAQTMMASKVEETFIEERINRMKRREAGQATFGDTIKRLWGWDRP